MVTRAEGYELYKDEYLLTDGTETVTYSLTEASEDTSVVAKRMDFTKLASQFDPADLELVDIAWIIYAETLSLAIKKNATITDSDGVEYTIQSFVKMRFDTQYHCICSRLPSVS